jgi:hypothetical protein
MRRIAKLSKNGRSPAVIHARKPESWDDLFTLADATGIPADFLRRRDRRTLKKRRVFSRP